MGGAVVTRHIGGARRRRVLAVAIRLSSLSAAATSGLSAAIAPSSSGRRTGMPGPVLRERTTVLQKTHLPLTCFRRLSHSHSGCSCPERKGGSGGRSCKQMRSNRVSCRTAAVSGTTFLPLLRRWRPRTPLLRARRDFFASVCCTISRRDRSGGDMSSSFTPVRHARMLSRKTRSLAPRQRAAGMPSTYSGCAGERCPRPVPACPATSHCACRMSRPTGRSTRRTATPSHVVGDSPRVCSSVSVNHDTMRRLVSPTGCRRIALAAARRSPFDAPARVCRHVS